MSLNADAPASLAAFCACGIPSATFSPSGVVTNAPSSLAAVNRVAMKPNATVLARTPNAGPHSFAMVLVRPTRPAFARA
ncbi:serine/threonine protein [Teratosphaeria destructans]|uniref:Serine/threonine protein n=1 Tax=Teratosphaeria destructans TaxID=418781 RepID=A0A9W7T037_9PEZI|nr:serine/threonine protein [Teratosphaeria destructans]